MKTIKTSVYEFAELNNEAKDKARDWYRQGALDYEWWEGTYEDATNIGLRITGFDLDRSRNATGEFNCLGQGRQVAGLILANHGSTCETFKTATAWIKKLDALDAEIEAVDGDDETNADWETWQDKRGLLEDEFLKSLLEDYSIILQKKYEYLLSDEAVDESIEANEYTFTASGRRF